MDFKEMKKRARGVLKSHYWLFVLVCLFTSLIGVENTDVVERLRGALSISVNVREDIVYSREVGLADIWHYVFENGEKDEGYGSGRYDHIGPVELGRVDGVFAKVINSVTSGTFVVNMFLCNKFCGHAGKCRACDPFADILFGGILCVVFYCPRIYGHIEASVSGEQDIPGRFRDKSDFSSARQEVDAHRMGAAGNIL